jgi:creatinine amidohydrolase
MSRPGGDWRVTYCPTASTLSAVVRDIATSARGSGFRRLVLWNSHRGNRALVEVLARDARARTGVLMFSSFRRPSRPIRFR